MHRPQLRHGLGEARFDLLFVAHVAVQRKRLGAVRLQFCQRSGVLLRIRAPDAHGGTRLGKRFGHSQANAAVAASDEDCFAGKIESLVGHGRDATLESGHYE